MPAILHFPSDTRSGTRTRTHRSERDFKSDVVAIHTNDLGPSQSVEPSPIVRVRPVESVPLTAKLNTKRDPYTGWARHVERTPDHTLNYIRWRVVVDDNGCWIWQGAKVKGYGKFIRHGRKYLVHRWVFQHTNGPIGADVMVCHTCDVKACCNPAHLYAGDAQTNARDVMERGLRRTKTHCAQGHPYDEANTYKRSKSGRTCRACTREWKRRYNARRGAA